MLDVNRYKCCYCGACVSACPTCSSLELMETWIKVSQGCKKYGVCTKICPVGALEAKV
jgi:ferredoxin